MIIKELKVNRNYRIIIPKVIVEKLGIKIGDKVIVIYDNNEIKIIPKRKKLKALEGVIKNLNISSNDINNIINEAIDELADQIKKEYKK